MHKHTMTPVRPRSGPMRDRQPPSLTRRSPSQPAPRQATLERWFWHAVGQFWDGLERKWLFFSAVGVVWMLACWLLMALVAHAPLPGQQVVPPRAAPSQNTRPTPPPGSSSVASRVPALYQGALDIGWDSPAQHDRWWASACAPAALTAVLHAWGAHIGIGPVLDQLIAEHAISVEQGLLDANALAVVARTYGNQAITFWHWSAAQVAQVTGQGVPVLVLLNDAKQQTPYPAFVTGHWLVVTSVTDTQVEVKDSSGYHIHSLSPDVFRTLFTGIGVVVWQGKLSLPQEG